MNSNIYKWSLTRQNITSLLLKYNGKDAVALRKYCHQQNHPADSLFYLIGNATSSYCLKLEESLVILKLKPSMAMAEMKNQHWTNVENGVAVIGSQYLNRIQILCIWFDSLVAYNICTDLLCKILNLASVATKAMDEMRKKHWNKVKIEVTIERVVRSRCR